MQMSKNRKYVHQHWLMMTWVIYMINNFNITKTNINKWQNKITKLTLGYTSCCDTIHKRKVKRLSITTQLWHCNWKDLLLCVYIPNSPPQNTVFLKIAKRQQHGFTQRVIINTTRKQLLPDQRLQHAQSLAVTVSTSEGGWGMPVSCLNLSLPHQWCHGSAVQLV